MRAKTDVFWHNSVPFLPDFGTLSEYFAVRNAPIRNKENGNPKQGTHQFETRNAPIRNEERTDSRKERTCHDVTSCS